MTAKTEFAIYIGHFQQMHHTKAVMYIVTGGTFHPATEKHIVIDSTAQSAVGGGWRKESPVTGSQSIRVIERNGVFGTHIVAGHTSNPGRGINEIGSGTYTSEIFKGHGTIMTTEA